jgi:hypothetical protein
MNVAHDGQGTQYIYLNDGQTGSAPAAPQDGVVVDGMAVSNLFAYDAAGNPIDGVQLFDDRGRPVRTTRDAGTDKWSLPGVAETWSFVSAQDEDGRQLWNVYPLRGAPAGSFEWNDAGQHVPTAGTTPRIPPRPFAKAPAVALPGRGAETAAGQSDAPSPEPTTGASVSPSAVASDPGSTGTAEPGQLVPTAGG